jgi:hypothetical protein
MARTAQPNTSRVDGFGFDPAESEHHFLVTIPAKKDEHVYISEHFTWEENQARQELSIALGSEDAKMRVVLHRLKWEDIAEPVQIEFNQRLRSQGLKPGKWKTGRNPVSRPLGKELVLLAWAIEDADPALISVAVRNWLGLAPEERWWMFTMTNAATGHAISGRNKGWRKAVRFALTENPVSEHRSRRFAVPLFASLADEDYIVEPNSSELTDPTRKDRT